jgi:hypothetical protein
MKPKRFEDVPLFEMPANPGAGFRPRRGPVEAKCIKCGELHKRRDGFGRPAPTCPKCAMRASGLDV